jgi:hypothetical protein
LTQIQKLSLTDFFYDRLVSQPELKDSFELGLRSCMQTFSALEKEIRELSPKSNQIDDQFQRLNYLWKEETMREILQQLRSQQNAINVALTAIQAYDSRLLRYDRADNYLAQRADFRDSSTAS